MPEFRAWVLFKAEGTIYGQETYELLAEDERAAKRDALELSEDSAYHDTRINFVREVEVEEID
jgi:hypothetical protein